ncbi:MAG: FTR1 family protein [Halioglobus sp.]
MLINSVILVLREVLEAALLVSVLFAISSHVRCGKRWLLWSLPLGLLGVVAVASSLETITDSLDGAGQEVLYAGMQLLVYVFLVAVLWCAACARAAPRGLAYLMAGATACAITREGSEIMVYITGFAAAEEHRLAVFAGSAIGAGIGLSLGVLLFNALVALKFNLSWIVTLLLVGMIGSGMVMQATMLLQQVDWLASSKPLWDSSAFISESSVTGELLYASLGYEATPSGTQVLLYFLSAIVSGVAYGLSRVFHRGKGFE